MTRSGAPPHRRRSAAPSVALGVVAALLAVLLPVQPVAAAVWEGAPGASSAPGAPTPAPAPAPDPGPVPVAAAPRAAGGAPVDAGATSASSWGWPLAPAPQVLRPFDPPAQRWSPGHRGVDLAAAPGSTVLAPAAGQVVLARQVVDRVVVVVAHPDGLRSTLEPVQAPVAVGTELARGERVADAAAGGGHCGAGCLHWGVRRGETYLDPLGLLVPPAPPVLLPAVPMSP